MAQNPHMLGTDSQIAPATGLVTINVSSADQLLNPWGRGIDATTSGNFAVTMADGSTGVVYVAQGTRWWGHIQSIQKTNTTGAGCVVI